MVDPITELEVSFKYFLNRYMQHVGNYLNYYII